MASTPCFKSRTSASRRCCVAAGGRWRLSASPPDARCSTPGAARPSRATTDMQEDYESGEGNGECCRLGGEAISDFFRNEPAAVWGDSSSFLYHTGPPSPEGPKKHGRGRVGAPMTSFASRGARLARGPGGKPFRRSPKGLQGISRRIWEIAQFRRASAWPNIELHSRSLGSTF